MEPTTPINVESSPSNQETQPQPGGFVEQSNQRAPEMAGNQMPVLSSPQPQTLVQTVPEPVIAIPTTPPAAPVSQPVSDDPMIADDVDVIEKE